MTLTDVAVELYALPPAEFTATRTARARQARADGDRDLAGRITALRKPTLAAWAVDLLVRQRPEQVEELLALGPLLLRAQAARAGDELRELNRRHHALMAALRADARRLAADAGQRLGDTVDVPLESTLRAAMTDPDAAAAVRSGLLVADLMSTGFGPVEVGDAVAVPDAPPLTSPPAGPGEGVSPEADADEVDDEAVALPRRRGAARTASRPTSRRPAGTPSTPAAEDVTGAQEAPARATTRRTAADGERAAARTAKAEREAAAREAAHRHERERAARDLEAAQERAEAAARDLADAEAALEDAARDRADLDAEVERLAAELADARDRREAADREERRAATSRDSAAQAADTADRRARAARERLDALG